jgi:hypothetical protein
MNIMTNQEIMDQYADTVRRFGATDMDDPMSDTLELECTRLEKVGAERGIINAMCLLMMEIMNEF